MSEKERLRQRENDSTGSWKGEKCRESDRDGQKESERGRDRGEMIAQGGHPAMCWW